MQNSTIFAHLCHSSSVVSLSLKNSLAKSGKKVSFKNPQVPVNPMMARLSSNKKIKIMNLAMFRFPTQLLIHVQ